MSDDSPYSTAGTNAPAVAASATAGCRFMQSLILAFVVALSASATAYAVEIGSPAPAFSLPSLDSDARISLDQFKGKVVFVDFWASWCEPCRRSLPQYEKLHIELAHEDFVILAVNLDEQTADANAFLKEHPVSYTILRDPSGDVPKAFGLVGMPTSYLIDRNGVVSATHTGFKPSDIATLHSEIHALLEKHEGAK